MAGMRVSVDGLIGRIVDGQRPNKGHRYMLGEFLRHLHMMADAHAKGDHATVREFCHLYCLTKEEEPK